MTLSEYIEDIKDEVAVGVLELEITDEQIGRLVLKCFREVQRYIDETRLVEVPFSGCIDLTNFKYHSIVNIYRSDTLGNSGIGGISAIDPMYASIMTAFGTAGGTVYNLQNYVLNYASYTSLGQMRNTMSTDLSFREDRQANKLYINVSCGTPKSITIEYIPEFEDVDDIKSEHWKDLLGRMSLAMTKKALGRIRTRFKVNNLPYSDDGDVMLAEGTKELEEIRELMRKNNNVFLPVD